jgi:hypothetical protein
LISKYCAIIGVRRAAVSELGLSLEASMMAKLANQPKTRIAAAFAIHESLTPASLDAHCWACFCSNRFLMSHAAPRFQE